MPRASLWFSLHPQLWSFGSWIFLFLGSRKSSWPWVIWELTSVKSIWTLPLPLRTSWSLHPPHELEMLGFTTFTLFFQAEHSPNHSKGRWETHSPRLWVGKTNCAPAHLVTSTADLKHFLSPDYVLEDILAVEVPAGTSQSLCTSVG